MGRVSQWPWLLVALSVLFNAIALWPEFGVRVPSRNDHMFHVLMIQGASDAIGAGRNPLDFWIPQLELGFPQFLYYQHLPHLLLGAVHRLLGGSVSAGSLLHGTQYLLLVGMPCTVAWSMRRLGFSAAASAFGAVASTLLSADNRMALEYNSYLWRGFGLFSQLCGIHLFFITAARLVMTMRTGVGYAASAAWLAALVLSHLLFGAFMALTSVVLWIASGERRTLTQRLIRLALVGAGAFALCAYLIVPFLESSGSYLSSVKWNTDAPASDAVRSIGNPLLRGELLDFGRLPVFTLLALAGSLAAIVSATRTTDIAPRLVAIGVPFWMLLYVVRPGAGPLAGILPGHSGAASYRFASMMAFFCILAAGFAAGKIAEWLAGESSPLRRWMTARARIGATLSIFLLLLTPAVIERWTYFTENREIIQQASEAFEANTDVRALLGSLPTNGGGRTYAGPVRGRSCAMAIGRAICLADLLNAQGTATVGNPMQGLSLSAGLVFDLPLEDAAMYDLLDVRWVVSPASAQMPAFYRRDTTFGQYARHRVATSGATQFVAVTARNATTDQSALWAANQQWLRDGGAARREVVRWDYDRASGPLARRTACLQPSVAGEQVESQRITVDVECRNPAGDTLAIAFKMTYHPQWQVSIDGNPVETYMVSPGFLAVDVLTGPHRIEARYVAHPRKLPLLAIGLLVFAGFFMRGNRAEAVVRALSPAGGSRWRPEPPRP